ncbi:MAG: pentapeptide repeat-containing protein, partial [Gammaproteobacteria bacterium]|nr:pentapeptide repeat-containing protein [Gammaproteobacteria bacterium]
QTCSFKFADLTATRFTRCDISMCSFSRSKIYRTELIQCQAQGIDCSHAQAANTVGNTVVLQGAKMHDCNFAYADFSGAELAESELTNNRMSHCLLHRADLSGTQLVDCELHGIDATGITLRGADLRGSDLTGLDVREVDMTEVKINSYQQTMLLETLGMIIDDT